MYLFAPTYPPAATSTSFGEIWYAENIRGGSNFTTTMTFAGLASPTGDMVCLEYSGLSKSGMLGQVASSAGINSPVSFGPISTGKNELVLTAAWSYGGPVRFDLTPGINLRSTINETATFDSITTIPGIFINSVTGLPGNQTWGVSVSFKGQ